MRVDFHPSGAAEAALKEDSHGMPVFDDAVALFVRESSPDCFCPACLALKVGATLAEAREAAARLVATSSFELVVRECGACTRNIQVLCFLVDA